MTELSGFTAAQPIAAIGPQALQVPTMDELCQCDCPASRMLKGFAQLVTTNLTSLIEIDIQQVPDTGLAQCRVRPWAADGVKQNGVANPGGQVVIDGSNVVGMSNDEYATLFVVPEPPVVAPEPNPEDAPPA